MIKGKRVIVTGGAGSIGSEIVRQLAIDNKVFIFDISENGYGLSQELKREGLWVEARIGDIRNKETIKDLFEDFKPQYIFHAAAYKEVGPMETYPKEAIETNIMGTANIIHEASRWECLEKLINISTDKAVNSKSIMGQSKKFAETMVSNKGKGYISVRFGNVINSRGSLIPIWQKQIDSNKPITVTDVNMERYFMTINDAVKLVIKAAECGVGGEIFCLDMGKKININELATKLIKELQYGKIDVTGIRPGETLTEDIMTEEEKNIAIKSDEFYIIRYA